MNLTIKNIPENVYREFKQAAATQGRSLNAQLIQALAMEAAELERRRQMKSSRKELERFVASLPKMKTESWRLLRRERERRDERGRS
jgi:plasmid stability protein